VNDPMLFLWGKKKEQSGGKEKGNARPGGYRGKGALFPEEGKRFGTPAKTSPPKGEEGPAGEKVNFFFFLSRKGGGEL